MARILSHLKPTNDEHIRFGQQAGWTQDLRQYLYNRIGIHHARRVLDVGCGTGVLFGELQSLGLQAFGVDIDSERLRQAKQYSNILACANAKLLPYPAQTFNVTLCHFVLLWAGDPVTIVGEMARVTQPGGWVLALAEPDYGGRIDYPEPLSLLGAWQSEALRQQGADPQVGRKLASIFLQAGLENIETGVLGGQWPASQSAWELEWQVLQDDLAQLPDAWQQDRLPALYEIERQSRTRGERVLFVPTFWALGKPQKNTV
ncbi:MAG: class I SAM-dependent methyltransferase [Chloroflexota bacterium]